MMDGMFDRTPPFSVEAEVAVLGAIIMDNAALPAALEFVGESSFYLDANRRMFRAFHSIWERTDTVDPVTIIEELRRTEELEAVGGVDYIGRLMDAVPTAANVEYHAKIVAERASLRRMIEALSMGIQDAYEIGDRAVPELIGEIEARVMGAASKGARDDSYARIKDVLWDVFEDIERLQAAGGKLPGISTGIRSVDRMTLGLHKGDLTVIAARPSMGKTALALGFALHAAITLAIPTLYVSLEMNRKKLGARALAHEGRVDQQVIRGGRVLEPAEHERLARAAGFLNNAPIYFDDAEEGHITSIAARVRRARIRDEIGLVFIDYMQLLGGTGKDRREEIEDISRKLKRLATGLDIPVVSLAQLSRGPESRPNKRPILSDLRDTGAIEQDADTVLLLFRPEYYMTDDEIESSRVKNGVDPRGKAEIIIPKQRNGPTGTALAHFDKPTTRFSDREERT